MSLLLVIVLLALIATGAPIAVAIGAASCLAFFLPDSVSPMVAVQRMYGGADSFPLMAVPLFLFAGSLMEAGGLSRRIIDLADAMVGWLPGGLAAVSIVSAMFFAGISGSAAADTAAVGALLIPAMSNRGYSPAFSGAVQAAGGSIGVIIPPSIPMIVFGVLTGASIGKLFAAGLLPGLLMGATLIVVAAIVTRRSFAFSRSSFSLEQLLRCLTPSLWALGAPVLILGGILGGVFTATESAAVAVVYALFVGVIVYKELHPTDIWRRALDSAVTSGVIMFIIAQATVFSWLLALDQAPAAMAGTLLSITDNPFLLLFLLNAVLLVAGTILETTAALLLFVPIIMPLLPTLGIDVVQLGAIVVVNLAIGMLTPPLGICLVVSSGLSGASIVQVSRAVLPFLLALLFDLALISFWPPLTTWLPSFL